MDYLGRFNDTFRDFMSDLLTAFPNDADFRMYQLAINGALMLNDQCVLNVFKEQVLLPYEAKILAKDEGFFLQNEYEEHSDSIAVVEKLKACWTQLSAEDRETIWKYFRVLLKLAKRI
jgi:hypothetical protein